MTSSDNPKYQRHVVSGAQLDFRSRDESKAVALDRGTRRLSLSGVRVKDASGTNSSASEDALNRLCKWAQDNDLVFELRAGGIATSVDGGRRLHLSLQTKEEGAYHTWYHAAGVGALASSVEPQCDLFSQVTEEDGIYTHQVSSVRQSDSSRLFAFSDSLDQLPLEVDIDSVATPFTFHVGRDDKGQLNESEGSVRNLRIVGHAPAPDFAGISGTMAPKPTLKSPWYSLSGMRAVWTPKTLAFYEKLAE